MMIQLEEINSPPTFTNQLENKILYSNHSKDISVSYQSTYTIKYVIDGLKHYNYNQQDIKVCKNQYVILNKDSQITTEAKKGTKGLSFFLSPELIQEISLFFTGNSSPVEFLEVTQKTSDHNINRLLKSMAYQYEHKLIHSQKQLDDAFIKISELIVFQQNLVDQGFDKLKVKRHNTKRELYQLITEAKSYLHDNLQEHISLNTISSDIGISKYYLHRLFTEINGITPLGYLTSIRLEKAKNLLQYSNNSILDIAISCGFDNTSYFSNLFKKHIGLSPSQFRKAI
ncbi:AraC family transcriptional regulator [Aquimarina sp. D1M17]|uniref:AraC family transcriptional regulator n=1 Tax=Aquimarina acroporae TaxID=2937283 RepID=UPI0020C00630|nr:AraC family transcriptional regulator [Aquimarina acroporae]MCK8520476.1 AraC family transcriptional regulator [Aquimarina acroporae]